MDVSYDEWGVLDGDMGMGMNMSMDATMGVNMGLAMNTDLGMGGQGYYPGYFG